MGQIITFYSYKGGTGRSMALANIAVLLAQWNYKVLIADWDLDAPGLEHFFYKIHEENIFEKFTFSALEKKSVINQVGIIEILYDMKENKKNTGLWEKGLTTIIEDETKAPLLSILTAGKKNKFYHDKVKKFDFYDFYDSYNGGESIESLRNEWKKEFDFVLIDSRTGFTDIGGICTIQLPDLEFLFFTPMDQSLDGIITIANNADKKQKLFPDDRLRLEFIPIMSRVERSEDILTKKWLTHASQKLSDIYKTWCPGTIEPKEMLQVTKIPYKPYYSFGESLPVLNDSFSDKNALIHSYLRLAAIIANKLDHLELIVHETDRFIQKAQPAPKKRNLPSPLGVMMPDAETYIEREADRKIWNLLDQDKSVTITLEGCKHTGKSSLIQRMIKRIKDEKSIKTAYINFKEFSEESFTDEKLFIIEFSSKFAKDLELDFRIEKQWNQKLPALTILDQSILDFIQKFNKHFILFLDEPQLIINDQLRNNFFGILRTWHNNRSKQSGYEKMSIVMITPRKPNYYIENLNMSPFNVAEQIQLDDFTIEKVRELNHIYRNPLNSSQIFILYDLLNGHPYLTHLSLYLVCQGKDFDSLLSKAFSNDGPFQTHFGELLEKKISPENNHLIQSFTEFLENRGIDTNVKDSLIANGLIREDGNIRNKLYKKYFTMMDKK